jgi:hypothetical protein
MLAKKLEPLYAAEAKERQREAGKEYGRGKGKVEQEVAQAKRELDELTDEQVGEIRRDGAPWVRHPNRRGTILLVRRLAKRFGVDAGQIKRILRGERWRELGTAA